MSILSCAFYLGDTVQTAQRLLGIYVVRMLDGQALVARSTETEAYVGRMDKAAHAYNYRQTARNAAMFGPPGHAYVYMIYGMHHCLNFVTEPEGTPCAVLIRGAKAVENEDIIAENRFGCKADRLTAYQRKNFLNGPGKLCRGLMLTREQHGLDLTDQAGQLTVCAGPPPQQVFTGERIGIDYAQEAARFPWRFWTEE